jgi:hypothetical protein
VSEGKGREGKERKGEDKLNGKNKLKVTTPHLTPEINSRKKKKEGSRQSVLACLN